MEDIFNIRMGTEYKPCCSRFSCPILMQPAYMNNFMMNIKSPFINHRLAGPQFYMNQLNMPSIFSIEMKPVPIEEIEE